MVFLYSRFINPNVYKFIFDSQKSNLLMYSSCITIKHDHPIYLTIFTHKQKALPLIEILNNLRIKFRGFEEQIVIKCSK